MYTIRRALPEDVNTVHQLLCELEDRIFELAPFSDRYIRNLASPDHIYLVAEEDHELLGLLTCHGQNLLHHLGITYEIQELIVRDQARSKGIGKALLDQLEMELKDKDYEMLEVASNMRRERAHAFYLREGFIRSHYKFTKARTR
jgi:PhnO protein